MSNPTLNFWFDYASTYSHLSILRIEALARRYGVEVVWQPFLLGPIFQDRGFSNSPFVLDPVRGAYMWQDVARRAQGFGLPFRQPTAFPRASSLPLRVAALAATTRSPWLAEFSRRVMTQNFVEDAEIGAAEQVLRALAGLVPDPAGTLTEAQRDENKPLLRTQTETARRLGIFGAPSFIVDGELYWGDDRLENALEAALRSADAERPSPVPLGQAEADIFFADWIAAWNAHDLDRVLAHYGNEVEMRSPFIVQFAGEPSGCLRGKAAVGDYWRRALAQLPDLHFDALGVTVGIDGLVMSYRNQRGQRVAERVEFGADGRIIRASASYGAIPTSLSNASAAATDCPATGVAVLAAEAPVRARPSVYPEPFAARMAGREKRPLGELFGLSNFGVNLTRLRPGAVSSLRHAHTRQDEFIHILSGHPTLHTDAGLTPLAPGMCAGFRAGSGDGHRLINTGDEDVVYLEIGDRSADDAASYPDDDLVARRVDGAWVFTHKDGSPY